MSKGEELITLVVHSANNALKLKEILEFHDIHVTLEDVVAEEIQLNPAPKKVRIPVSSLSLGLKILESGETYLEPLALIKMTGMGNTLLIPVDFSSLNILAIKVGFYLAKKFGVEPMLLHAFATPLFPMTEAPSIDMPVDDMELEAEESADLRKQASSQLLKLKNRIRTMQLEGSLPDVKFSTTLLEGVPEQVILEYCKQNKPLMVVMATRGADKKGSDLVGSVTAEVIDSCRLPVVTIPEKYLPGGIDKIKRVALFCTFTGFDVLVMRWLMRTFDYPACQFSLIPVSDRHIPKAAEKLEQLSDYLKRVYPAAEFHIADIQGRKFDEGVKKVLEEHDTQLIIVPNKKSSALSRFFRPTLAHRILFEKELPLLVLPV